MMLPEWNKWTARQTTVVHRGATASIGLLLLLALLALSACYPAPHRAYPRPVPEAAAEPRSRP